MDLTGILRELKIKCESLRRAIEIFEERPAEPQLRGRRPRSLTNVHKMRIVMVRERFKWSVPRIAESLQRPVPVVRGYLRARKS
jgi:hypothetical protein